MKTRERIYNKQSVFFYVYTLNTKKDIRKRGKIQICNDAYGTGDDRTDCDDFKDTIDIYIDISCSISISMHLDLFISPHFFFYIYKFKW